MGGDGPPRGGTRGGRDQFNWEAVKTDKDREFYLGASVNATVGRWQKGRDILWYTRDKTGGPGGLADELAAVKAEEDRVRVPRARIAAREAQSVKRCAQPQRERPNEASCALAADAGGARASPRD